jgi:hypothetical protein
VVVLVAAVALAASTSTGFPGPVRGAALASVALLLLAERAVSRRGPGQDLDR